MKPYFIAIGIWVLSILIVFAFPFDIPFVTWLAIIGFLVAGLLLAIILIVLLVRARKKLQAASALLVVLLVGVISFNGGFRLGAQLHLLVNERRYNEMLNRLSAESDPARKESICGDRCLVLTDDPLRVAFHFCHGFLNWFDIVYDPTAVVTQRKLPPERTLGVYHVGGEHLRADWYIGYFAD
jgi:hypothetical protein